MAIRPIGISDRAAAMALFQRSVHGLTQGEYNAQQRDAWAPPDLDPDIWSLRLSACLGWLWEDRMGPAGFITLERDGHLDLLYVDPLHTRRGIATALLAQAEDAARRLELPCLFTEASLTAAPFFLAQGFALITRQSVLRRGQSLTHLVMEKSLGS